MNQHEEQLTKKCIDTGKFLSEALIFASTNLSILESLLILSWEPAKY